MNVPVVAPAAIVTLAGTVAADVLSEESATTAPPDGGAEVRVIVPVEVAPEVYCSWIQCQIRNRNDLGGSTVKVAVLSP